MVSGFGFLLEIVWSSLVVNPGRALFYSGSERRQRSRGCKETMQR
jgi:hypothetical protein